MSGINWRRCSTHSGDQDRLPAKKLALYDHSEGVRWKSAFSGLSGRCGRFRVELKQADVENLVFEHNYSVTFVRHIYHGMAPIKTSHITVLSVM